MSGVATYLAGLRELVRARGAAGGRLPQIAEGTLVAALDRHWRGLSEDEQAEADRLWGATRASVAAARGVVVLDAGRTIKLDEAYIEAIGRVSRAVKAGDALPRDDAERIYSGLSDIALNYKQQAAVYAVIGGLTALEFEGLMLELEAAS